MIFYAQETSLALALVSLFVLGSIFVFSYTKKEGLALLLLLLGAFFLRILMISLDPYLNEWDERFHALVAKNVMEDPFKPMLRVNPIMPYNIEAWCCNHIWVHKQPLFLWQMALSMKIFGVNALALRIPSAIMGTIAVFFVYDIAKQWTKDKNIAFLAAFLLAVSNYQLEMISGRLSLDHNDLAFSFYVTASIWAFSNYVHRDYSFKWAALVGLFVGAAILVKWLTGLLIYGAWGLWLLLEADKRWDYKHYLKWLFSLAVACVVFIPWQWYITSAFPQESAIMYAHNKKHIFEALDGHQGNNWTHIYFLQHAYSFWLLPFIPVGFLALFLHKNVSKSLTAAYIAAILVIFAFFSLVVKTKMPAFPYPVNGLVWVSIAAGIMTVFKWLVHFSFFKNRELLAHSLTCLLLIGLGYYNLRPNDIKNHRKKDNAWRNAKIHNTSVYKSLDIASLKDRVVLNCKSFEDTELMFYKNVNAYHWYPEQKTLDSLLAKGHRFAAFKNHGDQNLPAYITDNKEIQILNVEIR